MEGEKMTLEGNAEFVEWLKTAVKNYSAKSFTRIEEETDEFGTTVAAKAEGGEKIPFHFGTFTWNEAKEKVRIYVWFYIGHERARKRVSDAAAKRLEVAVSEQKTGTYLSKIESIDGEVWFYLGDEWYEAITSDDVAKSDKQAILDSFFAEVMNQL